MDNEEKKEKEITENSEVELHPETEVKNDVVPAPVEGELPPLPVQTTEGDESPVESGEQKAEEAPLEEEQILTGPNGEIFDEKSELQWYFIQVLSGNEDKVAKLINETVKAKGFAEEILNAIVPKVEKPEKNKKGEKKLVLKKVYPGYVLLRMRMKDENWNFIRNVNNVIDFVGEKYHPTSISREEWEEIFMGKRKRKREEIRVKYNVNEKVKITDGPFANFFGDISEINEEKKHVKVMISIFGRLTPVELSYDEVEKI